MKKGQLRIWHNSNLGQPAFTKKVDSIKEAKDKLDLLANYDLYLGDKITANAQGLEVFVGNAVDYETNLGWTEWEDKEGNNIDETEVK